MYWSADPSAFSSHYRGRYSALPHRRHVLFRAGGRTVPRGAAVRISAGVPAPPLLHIRRCELKVVGREFPEPSLDIDPDETGLRLRAKRPRIPGSDWVPGVRRNAGVLCRQLGPKTDKGVDQGAWMAGSGHVVKWEA
jgi:hypothetical protein